jgi:hypothetical protein
MNGRLADTCVLAELPWLGGGVQTSGVLIDGGEGHAGGSDVNPLYGASLMPVGMKIGTFNIGMVNSVNVKMGTKSVGGIAGGFAYGPVPPSDSTSLRENPSPIELAPDELPDALLVDELAIPLAPLRDLSVPMLKKFDDIVSNALENARSCASRSLNQSRNAVLFDHAQDVFCDACVVRVERSFVESCLNLPSDCARRVASSTRLRA